MKYVGTNKVSQRRSNVSSFSFKLLKFYRGEASLQIAVLQKLVSFDHQTIRTKSARIKKSSSRILLLSNLPAEPQNQAAKYNLVPVLERSTQNSLYHTKESVQIFAQYLQNRFISHRTTFYLPSLAYRNPYFYYGIHWENLFCLQSLDQMGFLILMTYLSDFTMIA